MAKLNANSNNGLNFKSFPADAVDWDMDFTAVDDITGGTTGAENTDKDTVSIDVTEADITHRADMTIEGGVVQGNFTFESKDESIATVNQKGRVDWISDGTVTIRCDGPRGGKINKIPVSMEIGATTTQFQRFVNGSWAKAAHDQMLAIINGITASPTTQFLYSSRGFSSPAAYNPDCWALPNIDWTSKVMRDDHPINLSHMRALALITPRHCLGMSHTQSTIGAEYHFLTPDNTVVKRTLIDIITLHGGPQGFPHFDPSFSDTVGRLDFGIYLLDSDVPSTIHPAKLMDPNWRDYTHKHFDRDEIFAHSTYIGNGIPMVGVDRDKKVFLAESFSSFLFSDNPGQDDWEELADVARVIGATSPLPSSALNEFFILPNQINDSGVTLNALEPDGSQVVWWMYGYDMSTFIPLLTDVIDSMAPGYAPITYDLSAEGYTDFS